ncbi:histidine--tRNA ligase [Methylocaldum szegediense]|jgi:histidyl-tRNA synthetase|uniref:Histidine--tRNA ligase n=1 Tax=Methylocaldum szegediense TaxID=73780 RepID=A0ABN8X318_9GAMM|nr:histidine--tRNA ligase [Methylocaldum szegediense]CAI8845675.1 histidine--tRNA ligase [Methylocaldum szegediense]
MEKIQAIRGMHDILPDRTPRWQYVESVVRRIMASYGYEEIRLPLLEKTELFKRSIGEVTDIVEKEMYTFEDRNGDSLTLRPEGTAGCLRACMEHGLLYNRINRLWYSGPMFRHERPQKGRYRQFHQVGVEVYGIDTPDIDVELILLSSRLWRELGIAHKLELQINTLGTAAERLVYRNKLVQYFRTHYEKLDEDSRRRLETNPLRILDSKNPEMRELIQAAPVLADDLGEESRNHFQRLKELLDEAGISYVVNPTLVRGLDYYSRTVFEWVTDELGAQGTVCAGGRYDGLIEQLGGKGSAATGFALGMERLIELLESPEKLDAAARPHAYLIRVGGEAERRGAALAEALRDALPNLRLVVNCGGGSFKSQFKRADKSGAAVALILGEDEVRDQLIGVKHLRTEEGQRTLAQSELIPFLQTLI